MAAERGAGSTLLPSQSSLSHDQCLAQSCSASDNLKELTVHSKWGEASKGWAGWSSWDSFPGNANHDIQQHPGNIQSGKILGSLPGQDAVDITCMKECSSDIESPTGLEIYPSIASGISRSLSFSCLTQLPSHNLQNPFGNERLGRTFSGWGSLGSNAAPEMGYAPVATTADLTAAENNTNKQVLNT